MGGRYYKDPTADIAMANVKRKVKHRTKEQEKLRKDVQLLFKQMRTAGMSGKEIIEMLKTEYKKFLNS